MKGDFKISVIIPVYNAEKYIRQAVESAVSQNEVGEIILIEDGSPDKGLSVCEDLGRKYEKVRVFRHPNGENKGAGASRNLGVKKARYEYIAFLDADDVYLQNRFAKTMTIFQTQIAVVGVYEAIGVQFYDEAGKDGFCKMRNIPIAGADNYITRLKVDNPDDVYKYLITGRKGFFSTLGVTIKREAFIQGYYFNETLRLHQDTELWIRLSYNFRFAEGSKEPVALIGVHAENRISRQNLTSKHKYYSVLIDYFRKKHIPFSIKMHLYKSLVRNHPDRRHVHSTSRFSKFLELSKIAVKELPNLPLFL